jgi:NTE family protein
LGVLKVLEEEKIPISGLVGTSMGAVVAAIYAAGGRLDYLSRVATALSWEQLWDFRFPRMGLINGEKIMTVLRLLTKGKRLEELNPPVWVVATDLLTGTEVVFKEGCLETAIRATISIPGVFTPVRHGQYLLVDGGVVAGVPAGIARQMGADLVIAVNVSYELTPLPPGNIFEVLMKAVEIMGARLNDGQVAQADLVLTPRVGHVGTGHFSQAADCIAAGEEAARRMLPVIHRLLGRTRPGQGGCGCEKDEALARAR